MKTLQEKSIFIMKKQQELIQKLLEEEE